MAEATEAESNERPDPAAEPGKRGKTVHGAAANAGHRVLAPDDAEESSSVSTQKRRSVRDDANLDPQIAFAARTTQWEQDTVVSRKMAFDYYFGPKGTAKKT